MKTLKPYILGLIVLTSSLVVQGEPSNSQLREAAPVFAPARMPSDLMRHAEVLGLRVQQAGRELTVLQGQITDTAGSRAVSIAHQLPGLVRIDSEDGSVIAFDGDSRGSGLDRAQLNLLESLVMDIPEGLFLSARQGGAIRLLGRRFGPEPAQQPEYSGPRLDIFESSTVIRTHPEQPVRLKRYYFDSHTGLLLRTRYLDRGQSPAVTVETRFSNWGVVDGSSYPGRIERYEGGRLVFSIVFSSAASGPGQDPANFRAQ